MLKKFVVPVISIIGDLAVLILLDIPDYVAFLLYASIAIELFVIIAVWLAVYSPSKHKVRIEIAETGITLLQKDEYKRCFSWPEVEQVYLRIDKDCVGVFRPYFYVKPYGGSEVGVDIDFYIVSWSYHIRRINQAVLEYSGRSDLVTNSLPSGWKRLVFPLKHYYSDNTNLASPNKKN